MIIISELKKKVVEKSTINKLVNKIWKYVKNLIEKGMDSLGAYDEAIKDYELGEEIIITYEIEAKKAGLINHLDLKYDDIKKLKKRVKKTLFDKALKDFNNKK
ncbi:MAG: hypothetical protein ACFE9Z_02045 [Promethearchaeota archaeon]